MTAQLLNIKQQLSSHKDKKILLIEDNDINRMLLSDYLSYCKYEVQSLPEGSQFLSTIEKFKPNLILLDLKLPDIDGYSLLAKIQQRSDLQYIPIFVVSAFAFRTDQEKAMKLGARRYFVKPVNLTELILAIEEELACQCR
ncbi:response regulator [Fischerella thermalis]|jgi:two-component system cell cycle response regulator DivK|uniref:Response regulator receiver protein n=3 Tax=Fischerella TaxID=1190 RepID=G6FR15_9CYAN|nr:response regulator [Fischerella thermalis]PLZ82998.1 response regulator [Fischerella thermalis WC217]RDH49547.1 response regulator [Mastigocladus laminosus WC112]EHC15889.1 response regulator receiver protein [Fischerella thermalis JSC-11]MBF1990583.1 response regulator [Fischerella thermalis M58_A2018_009]MBF2070053.1 response regulator [Fischerella thermalis M48_A2018_028]